MLKIAICDDEPTILHEITGYVEKVIKESDVQVEYYSIDNSSEMMELIKNNSIDILLLDIDMPVMSGMDIARYLSEIEAQTLLIFITNKESLVYESFLYHPFGFIRKNFYQTELTDVLKNAVNHVMKQSDTYMIKNNAEIIRLKLSDILYFEADSNYVKLYTLTDTLRYRETLQELEKELLVKGFIRIHKGYLVNQQAISRIRYDEVILLNDIKLPIGRSNRDWVRSQLMKYMR